MGFHSKYVTPGVTVGSSDRLIGYTKNNRKFFIQRIKISLDYRATRPIERCCPNCRV